MEELLRLVGYVMMAVGFVFLATGFYLWPDAQQGDE